MQALMRLRQTSGIDALRSAIVELSSESGPLKSYSVSFDAATRTVFCFVETKMPLLDSELRELGAVGFGSGLAIEFAVGPEFSGSTCTWAR